MQEREGNKIKKSRFEYLRHIVLTRVSIRANRALYVHYNSQEINLRELHRYEVGAA